MQTLTHRAPKANAEKQVSKTIKGCLCILAWMGRGVGGGGGEKGRGMVTDRQT